MKMFSPLSQFDVFSVWNLNFGNLFFFNINNLNLVMFSVFVFFFLTYFFFLEEMKIIPKKIQFVFELLFLFVYRLVFTQTGKKGLIFMPFLFTIFIVILLLNVVSLMPFSFAVTSHFIWSLYIALSTCFGIFILGLINFKLDYLKIFLQNVPILLFPLMTLIELASYVIRAFSLAIRLSANLLAGHILVDIIAEVISFLNYYLIDLSFVVLALLIALFFLEVGVACLQAYVFILLITIYLNDAVNLHLHI